MRRLATCLVSVWLTAWLGAGAAAAPALTKKKRPRGRRGPASVTRQAAPGGPRMWLLRGGLTLGQEAIRVRGVADRATMEAQLQGLSFTGVYSVPFGRSRWSRLYGAELGLGTVKGRAQGADVNDEVKGQLFVGLTLLPGLSLITSPVSRVAVTLPLTYRRIQWKVGSGFNPDRDASFSVGAGGVFEMRFSIRSSLIVSATYYHAWQSTSLGLAYQRRLR